MNNHLPLQFTPRISVSWMVCHTMTCICFGCSALPPRFSEFIYRSIATSKNILLYFSCDRIEINNLLEVFVQISKTSFGFCNNLGLRPRLLPNPTSVFDICTNTSNSLFISIIFPDLLQSLDGHRLPAQVLVYTDAIRYLLHLVITLQPKHYIPIIKIRTSNHHLPIETGRWNNILRDLRKCSLCNRN